jgi:uncharacterized membrane protein YdbT with pleckstrin-like domain
MGYVDRNLVPGETLLYRTRHHWLVLLGPLIAGSSLLVPGIALLMEAIATRDSDGLVVGSSTLSPKMMAITGAVLVFAAIIIFAYGVAKRNATEMAVTNRRVVIKTGLASRKTIEMLLNKVESIEVSETTAGRMLGYGTIVVIGTGGTPEPFHKVAHPLEFRSQVQQQIEKLR